MVRSVVGRLLMRAGPAPLVLELSRSTQIRVESQPEMGGAIASVLALSAMFWPEAAVVHWWLAPRSSGWTLSTEPWFMPQKSWLILTWIVCPVWLAGAAL